MTMVRRPPPAKINISAASDGFGSQTLTPKLLGRSSSDSAQPALRLQHDDSAAANPADSSTMLASLADLDDSVSSTLTALSVMIAGHDGNDLTPSLLPRKKSNSFVDDAMEEESFVSILSKVSAMLTNPSILGQADDESLGGDDRSNLLDVSNHSFTPSADGSEDEARSPAQAVVVNPYNKNGRRTVELSYAMPTAPVNFDLHVVTDDNKRARMKFELSKTQVSAYHWQRNPVDGGMLWFHDSTPAIKALRRIPLRELLMSVILDLLTKGHSYDVVYNEKCMMLKRMIRANPHWGHDSVDIVDTSRQNCRSWKNEMIGKIDRDEIEDSAQIFTLFKQIHSERTTIANLVTLEALAKVIIECCHPQETLEILTQLSLLVWTGRRCAAVRSMNKKMIFTDTRDGDAGAIMTIAAQRLKFDSKKHPHQMDLVTITEKGVIKGAEAAGLTSLVLNPFNLVAILCEQNSVQSFPLLSNPDLYKNKSSPAMAMYGKNSSPLLNISNQLISDKIHTVQTLVGVKQDIQFGLHGARAGNLEMLCAMDRGNVEGNFEAGSTVNWKAGSRAVSRYQSTSVHAISNEIGANGQLLRTDAPNQLYSGAELQPDSEEAIQAKATLALACNNAWHRNVRADVLNIQTGTGRQVITYDDLVLLAKKNSLFKSTLEEGITYIKDDIDVSLLFVNNKIELHANGQPRKKKLLAAYSKGAKEWKNYVSARHAVARRLLEVAKQELNVDDESHDGKLGDQDAISVHSDSTVDSDEVRVVDSLGHNMACTPGKGVSKKFNHASLIHNENVIIAAAIYARMYSTDEGDYTKDHALLLPNGTRYDHSKRCDWKFYEKTLVLWTAAGVDFYNLYQPEFMRLLFRSIFEHAHANGGTSPFLMMVNSSTYVGIIGWNDDAEIAHSVRMTKGYKRMKGSFRNVGKQSAIGAVRLRESNKRTAPSKHAFLDAEKVQLVDMKINGKSWRQITNALTNHPYSSLQSMWQTLGGVKKPRKASEPWTEKQLEELTELKRLDVDWGDIAKAVGRDKQSCKGKYANHMARLQHFKETGR
jgi:hypothetical protein